MGTVLAMAALVYSEARVLPSCRAVRLAVPVTALRLLSSAMLDDLLFPGQLFAACAQLDSTVVHQG